MKTYGEVINRIVEIINLSSGKVLPPGGEYKDYFVRILGRDIDIDLAPELRGLLDIERTFSILANTPQEDVIKNNVELMGICKERAQSNDATTSDYLSLYEILRSSLGKSSIELTEYRRYFVPSESLTDFIMLCRKLKVGPNRMVRDMSPEELRKNVDESIRVQSEQFKRINYHLTRLSQISETQTEVKENYSIKMDYKIFLYLGFSGKLSLEVVKDIKKLLNPQEYELLLEIFLAGDIFTEEEIDELRQNKETIGEQIDEMNNLVELFATRKDLNIAALKLLIPAIGKVNYHFLIEELFKKGVVNDEDYLNHIKEYIDELDSKDR